MNISDYEGEYVSWHVDIEQHISKDGYINVILYFCLYKRIGFKYYDFFSYDNFTFKFYYSL